MSKKKPKKVFVGHTLMIGMTGSGKSTLCKSIIAYWKEKGIKVAVLDPLGDPSFKADFQTKNPDEFIRYARRNKKHLLVIDEGTGAVGRYNKPMQWVATTARHLGHLSIIACHSATSLDPLVRGQCGVCYLFACAPTNAEIIAEEFNQPEAVKSPPKIPWEFLRIPRFGDISRFTPPQD